MIAHDAIGPRISPDLLPLFETLLGAVPVGLAFCDRGLRCLRVNASLAAMTDSPAEQHVGRLLAGVLPWLADEGPSILRAVMASGEPVVGQEISGETADRPGVRRQWVVSYHPARDGSGATVGASVVVMEVTEQREAAASPILDPAGTVVGTSAITRDIGRPVRVEDDPEDRERITSGLHAVIHQGHSRLADEYRYRRADGTYAEVQDRGRIIRDEDGRAARVVGGMVDITVRRRAEQAVPCDPSSVVADVVGLLRCQADVRGAVPARRVRGVVPAAS